MNNKPTLNIMVGLSGAGKSSIANQIVRTGIEYGEEFYVVSSDEIRGEICEGGVSDQSKNEEVFKIFHKRIQEYLKAGCNVIADATNITMKSRRAIINAVKGIECEIVAVVVSKKFEECLENNLNREYPVPHHVIHKQAGLFQVPFYEEGFGDILLFGSDGDCTTFYTDCLDKMKGFEQFNPHHTLDLYEHGMKVSSSFKLEYNHYCHVIGAMLHDIGKLFTQKFDEEGIAHYYQHENVGTYYLLSNYKEVSYDLDLNEDEMIELLFIVNYHMLPMNWNSEKSKGKWKHIFGEKKFNMLTFFHECDIIGK
jgi:predicted kinase